MYFNQRSTHHRARKYGHRLYVRGNPETRAALSAKFPYLADQTSHAQSVLRHAASAATSHICDCWNHNEKPHRHFLSFSESFCILLFFKVFGWDLSISSAKNAQNQLPSPSNVPSHGGESGRSCHFVPVGRRRPPAHPSFDQWRAPERSQMSYQKHGKSVENDVNNTWNKQKKQS